MRVWCFSSVGCLVLLLGVLVSGSLKWKVVGVLLVI